MRAITSFYIVLEATRVYQVSHSFKKDLMLDHLRSYCHTESYGYCGWSPVTHYWPIIRYWSLPKHIYNSHYGNGVPEMFIFQCCSNGVVDTQGLYLLCPYDNVVQCQDLYIFHISRRKKQLPQKMINRLLSCPVKDKQFFVS